MNAKVFLSYAHEDEEHRVSLEKHLAVLRRQNRIAAWRDRDILAGEEWSEKIDRELEAADIILFLVSADLLASDYCCNVEMQRALVRRKTGDVVVIPVIVRACDWALSPLARLQALPRDGKPVMSWPSQDQAWSDVARGIRTAVDALDARTATKGT